MILSSCGCKVSWALRGGMRLLRKPCRFCGLQCGYKPQKPAWSAAYLQIAPAHNHLPTSISNSADFFDGDGESGRSCCWPFSATVATIATVVLVVSDLPLQPSQPSRGLFVCGYEGQRDTPPFVPNLVLIADVVFVQQPARLHIQILAQYVCRHADMDGIGKRRGRSCPDWMFCG